MKVASVIFQQQDYKDINGNPKQLLSKIRNWLMEGQKKQVEIVVLPALIGNFYEKVEPQAGSGYLEEILKLSLDFGEIAICPGSWWEKDKQKDGALIYHTSGLIKKGSLLLQQRQLYLARWERETALSRGSDISTFQFADFSVCIQVSTDVFYPQVSRYAALLGLYIYTGSYLLKEV